MSQSEWELFVSCKVCDKTSIAVYSVSEGSAPKSLINSNPSNQHLRLERMIPESASVSAPEHTPENIGRYYEQGMDNLAKNWDAAGIMFRKTLDVGLKVKFPDLTGKLVKRINDASRNGYITQELAEWSHKVRIEGNDAAHDEDPYSEAEANELQTFTELLLMYLFMLPGMLSAAQSAVPSDES